MEWAKKTQLKGGLL